MDKTIILKLIAAIMLMLMYPKAESQWLPRRPMPINPSPTPLCKTQFTLANRACAMLPYTPVPPPSPPSPASPPPSPDVDRHRHRHGHGHGHGHRHHHRRHANREAPVEEECCRWIKEIDTVCVCDVLVHLPAFLTRPVHNYTVVVDDICDVTFECGSRWVH